VVNLSCNDGLSASTRLQTIEEIREPAQAAAAFFSLARLVPSPDQAVPLRTTRVKIIEVLTNERDSGTSLTCSLHIDQQEPKLILGRVILGLDCCQPENKQDAACPDKKNND